MKRSDGPGGDIMSRSEEGREGHTVMDKSGSELSPLRLLSKRETDVEFAQPGDASAKAVQCGEHAAPMAAAASHRRLHL